MGCSCSLGSNPAQLKACVNSKYGELFLRLGLCNGGLFVVVVTCQVFQTYILLSNFQKSLISNDGEVTT
ncbi:hypothetical protein J6590_043343 [Homalodisca vitripennis]|nr:hypothetical protein J6590_043343 [Homalodisca vitripennis]